jgi:hypothetical protein
MSRLTGKTTFERSNLPSESQLDLHCDGKQFLSLVREVRLEGKLLEELAEATHEIFCEGLRYRGYTFGPKHDDTRRICAALVPYAELSEEQKEQNRQNVRHIPVKLQAAGYLMVPARSEEPPLRFSEDAVEELAEAEHERWMRSMLDDGWAYNYETDRTKKLHRNLIPWDTVSEVHKDKDRDLVRGIPEILARAGYSVIAERWCTTR